MTPAAIVFDLDGTIVDTEWPVFEAIREAFRAHDLDFTIADWVDNIGRASHPSWTEMLTTALDRPPDAEIVTSTRDRARAGTDQAPALDGVLEVISAARSSRIPLAVASSSPRDWVERHLERLGLRESFGAIRTRDDVERGKPWPDLFLATAEALGCDPSSVLVIEDSLHGCAAAKAAGMRCIVVPNRITRERLPSDADLVLDSLVDFPFERFGMAPPGP